MMENRTLLYHAAKRASAKPRFVAFALAHYQRVHKLSDIELTTLLEMLPKRLPLLALCRRPSNEQEMQQIADYASCSAERLSQVLLE